VSLQVKVWPNFRSLKGKSFVSGVVILKSSLRFCKFDVRGDFEAESLQQDCLMFGGVAATAYPRSARCNSLEGSSNLSSTTVITLHGISFQPDGISVS